jgi:uncharacterized sulfatase
LRSGGVPRWLQWGVRHKKSSNAAGQEMNMKTVTQPLWAFALAVLVGSSAGVAAEPSPRPNFLIMIADDLQWRDMGCTGNPDVQTPHIDRLAKEGLTLRGMFTPAPTCSPARHALYTGLFPVRSGAYPNHTMVAPTTKSLFTYLKDAGYRVGLQAKSHVQPPQSFPYEKISNDADDAEALARFIGRDAKQPWLAVFASHDPHGPHDRGPRDLYDPAKLSVPPWMHDCPESRDALVAYYAEITKLDEQVGKCLTVLEKSGQADNTLVLFLSEQGSGFPYGGKWSLYDTGIRVAAFARWPGKTKPGSATEALMQYVDVAPTLLAAAGIDPTTIDTGCSDANGDHRFDGRSFLKVLHGQADAHRDYVFAQHTTVGINGYKEPYPIRAARDGRYKLIRNLAPENEFWIGGIHRDKLLEPWRRDAANDARLAARLEFLSHRPAEELYDLASDPYEFNNLAANPELADVKGRLGQALDDWMAQQGDRGLATELEAKSHQPRERNAKKSAGAKKREGKKRRVED